MTTCTENCAPQTVVNPGRSPFTAVVKWVEVQQLRMQIREERRQLLEMPDAVLKDMGITRAEAEIEAARRDLPESRLDRLVRRG